MTKQFCDRCGSDITQVQSAAISGIRDANANGDGTVTDSVDLCRRCYREAIHWMRTRPTRKS